jgi:hypothetical protein
MRAAPPTVQLPGVRYVLLAALVSVLAACGGGSGDHAGNSGTQAEPSLPAWVKEALGAKAGPDVAVTMGSSDFAVGDNRVVFLVVRNDGSLVQAPKATVEFASADGKPRRVEAGLEPIGAHEHGEGEEAESHDHLDVTDVYVAHMRAPQPGRYWFVVDPESEEIQAVGSIDVAERTTTPVVGAKAPASDNPTLADAPARAITTARPPDTELLRYSIADSLQAHVPFVAVFATPKFCQSRVCGPTVEVVQKVAQKFVGDGIRFIHVEIYADNDPGNGFNRWVREWDLPTEPWVFLVDEDGVIRAKFEGAVSVDELETAVRAQLRGGRG